MADLQSLIRKRIPGPSLNKSWIRPGYKPPENSSPQRLHQDLEEDSGHTDNVARQRRFRRPRPRKNSLSLLDRIQMNQGETNALHLTRKAAPSEKSLIERIELPDDMNGRLFPSTSMWARRQDRKGDSNWNSMGNESRNGRLKLIDETGSEPGVNHSQKHLPGPLNARQSGESSTYKQLPSREGSKDGSHPYATPSERRSSPRGDNITPNRDSSQGASGGSASTHNLRQPHEVTHASPSMTQKAFVDHLLPLAQQIANVRMETSDSTPPNGAEVNSSVITLEVLAQFSQQLINLTKDLHHHNKPSETQMLPLEETQDIGSESRVSPRPSNSLNGHDHHPEIFEGTAHLPSAMGKELPKRIRGIRTPTPEYLEKRRPSLTPHSHTLLSSRRYSSELRRTSRDFTQCDYWDHNEYRHSSRGMRAYLDRRSISPHRRRVPYSSSPSKKDRRDSSPTPYYRRDSPLRHRRRSPWSPERRRHSSEKEKHGSNSRRHTEPVSNHVKDPFAQADGSGSMLLQDLLDLHGGISPSQQRTKTLSDLKVPGLWFAFRGFQEIEMPSIEFEIDEHTTSKWNIQNKYTTPAGRDSCLTNQARFQLSLELSCFSLKDVQMTLENLGRDVRSHDLVKALASLKNTWPPQGHLIISINEESQNRKFWFPNIFTQKDSIKLEEFILTGINLVRFIHLSDLSGNIFVLLARANGIENDDDTRLNFLLPGKDSGIFQRAIPTISKG